MQASPAAAGTGRLVALDGLRGIAFASVVCFHVFELWRRAPLPHSLVWPQFLAMHTWAAIDYFLVCSGFLITKMLLRMRGTPNALRVFYLRRMLRIFPLYYLVLACLMLWMWAAATPHAHVLSAAHLSYWLYLQNFAIAKLGWADFRQLDHLWSLGVQEQFYLLWPWLVLLLGQQSLRRILLLMLLLAPLLRLAMVLSGVSYLPIYVLLFTRLDALAAGALLAVIATSDQGKQWLARASLPLLLGGLASIAVISELRGDYRLDDPFVQVFGYSANLIMASGAIALLAYRPQSFGLRALLSGRALTWLGNRSYAGYLLHWPIAIAVYQLVAARTASPLAGIWLTFGLTAALTLVMAEVSWRYWESRWLALRQVRANDEPLPSARLPAV